MYRITLKQGHILTDDDGRVVEGTGGDRVYRCTPHDEWRIIGIGRRHHSAHLVTLGQDANGVDIGQGWVHDVDHGTHRQWITGRADTVAWEPDQDHRFVSMRGEMYCEVCGVSETDHTE